MVTPTISAAFIGGILSFLSPCVLPLVPSYIGFLTGMTIEEMGNRRRLALMHAGLFVLGFSLIFIAMGAGASALGASLRYHKMLLAQIGGVLIIIFGLHALGVFRIGIFDREKRVHLERKPVGFAGSFLVGMAFAAGWTPCLGPILGGILTMSANAEEMSQGMLLLTAYSAGLAVPFMIAAWAIDGFRDWFQRFRRWIPWVQRASGILLIVVGILLLTGEFTRIASWLNELTPEWLRSRV